VSSWTETEWGVRWTSPTGTHVDNMSLQHRFPEARAREIVAKKQPGPGARIELVRREVTYTGWEPGDAPARSYQPDLDGDDDNPGCIGDRTAL
jgi:hypothetical protein